MENNKGNIEKQPSTILQRLQKTEQRLIELDNEMEEMHDHITDVRTSLMNINQAIESLIITFDEEETPIITYAS